LFVIFGLGLKDDQVNHEVSQTVMDVRIRQRQHSEQLRQTWRKTVRQLGENLAKLLGEKWATTCRKVDNSKEKTGKNSFVGYDGENWVTTRENLAAA
jgi:hypothetical protein